MRQVRLGESLQAAIDQALPGETLVLTRGTWTENLRIEKPLTLRGAGPEATILKAAQPGPPVVWIRGDVAVRLEGLAIQEGRGGYLSPSLSSAGIFAQDGSRVTLARVRIQNHAASGVFARDHAEVRVEKSFISGNTRYGLELIGQAQVVLEASEVVHNKTGGIWLAEEARAEAEHSEVSENGGPGVWVRNAASLRLFACELRANATYAVRVQDGGRAIVLGTYLAQHLESAVLVSDRAELRAYGSLWEANWNGLEVQGGSVYLERCTIRASRWDALQAQRGTVTVYASHFEGGRGTGLDVSGVAQAEIRASEIRGFAVAGIAGFSSFPVQGEGNLLRENGVELLGSIASGVRSPRAPAELAHLRLTSPEEDLQKAVDALLPGGVLELAPGQYPAGLTVDKPLEIRGEGAILVGRPEAPAISVVSGGDLRLVGIHITGASEGLALGAEARAELLECALRDNGAGIKLWQNAQLRAHRTGIASHPQGGLWLWDQTQAELEEVTLHANDTCGIGVGGRSRLLLRRSTLSANGWQGGLLLRDRAEVELHDNAFVNNRGYGIAVQSPICVGSGPGFLGTVRGRGNLFEGNFKGPSCPEALALRLGG